MRNHFPKEIYAGIHTKLLGLVLSHKDLYET